MAEARRRPRVKRQNIIASLVELTRQRDQISLRAKLLSVIVEVTDVSWLVLCRLVERHGDLRVEVLDRIPNPHHLAAEPPCRFLTRPEPFSACRAGEQGALLEGIGPYRAALFRLPDQEHCEDFIVLVDNRITARARRTVASVLDLYQNFLTLLIENTHDPLTRLYNRQCFEHDLAAALENRQGGRRHGDQAQRSFVVMFDIDLFKRVNDTFGHLYGDEVLLLFAQILRSSFRETDRIYRYGGEEFAALISFGDRAAAAASLERCRAQVEAFRFPQVGGITVSIGYTELTGHTLPNEALEEADRALYHSKAAGRNRVTFFGDIAATESMPSKGGGVELF